MACKVCIKRNFHNDRVVGGQRGRPSNTVIKENEEARNGKTDRYMRIGMYWMLEMLRIIRLEMRQMKNCLWLGHGQGRGA